MTSQTPFGKIKDFVLAKRWLQLLLAVLLGMMIGSSSASGGAPSDWSDQIADLKSQVRALDRQLSDVTAERDSLRTKVDDFEAAADAEQKAQEQAAAKKAAEEEAARQAAEEAAAKKAAEEAAAKRAAEEAAKQREQEEAERSAPQGQTVYVTRTGSKYHQGGCGYLSQSKIAISLADAQAQGYDP